MTRPTNTAPTLSVIPTRAQAIAAKLDSLGTVFRLVIEEDAVILEAHVPSGVAARMLKPLGRRAVGQFHALPGNMVVIDALVDLSMARRMLAPAGRMG
ncbi:hypothetical protein [Afipia sp. Root123D2]|uniref:hypothetical protein n=1 Tax=Afipia sp. Root123D2 TaxID=1736436 RepID=UPI000A3E45C1|nr:hypothetical protein [Afipia sp. Root123D2]